ncbi:MAG: ABC transporter ATP-binding protein [Candidatus Gracilibacteria bacterium]|nr:ABC transporter ATP-binding protein [Candidatus Gracilibacteria bacterium]
MKINFGEYQRSIHFILTAFSEHSRVLYFFIAGKVLEACFYIVFPILAKIEMDQLVEKNEQLFGLFYLDSFKIFLIILGIIFVLKLFENVLRSLLELFEFKYVKILEEAYLLKLYERLKFIEIGMYLNNRNKRMISKVLWSSYEIRSIITNQIGSFISNGITFVGILVVISLFNIYVFGILIISSVCIYFLNKYKEIYKLKHEVSESYEFEYKLNRLKYEVSDNLHMLSANSGFPLLLDNVKENNQRNLALLYNLQKVNTKIGILSFGIENITEFVLKMVIGIAIFAGTESIGFMTMSLLYVSRLDSIFTYIREFRFHLNHMQDMLKGLDLFLDFTENTVQGNDLIGSVGKVQIKNLTFAYPNVSEKELRYFDILEKRIQSYKGKKDSYDEDQLFMIQEAREQLKVKNPEILQNIHLDLESGKTYGIVGKNGAGKTTLIQLLLGYFKDHSGNIYFGDKDIQVCTQDSLFDTISVINQIPYILNDFSVKENILLGVKKQVSDEEIYILLAKFGLDKKVKKLRTTLDSKIGYDSDFSGGEKQLMVLIRNILQDKPILIMDEGTNQLDAENEILVMEELMKNKENKIVIFITHRMTSIRKADKIFCLENGKITDQGTHEELLGKENIYNNFWKKQVEY